MLYTISFIRSNVEDNCKRGLEWREPLLSYGHFSNKLRKKLIVTFKSVSIESLYKIPVNLRSAYLPPSAQQTRLAPFPSIIRLVSPSAAAAAATAIPKDEFPQVSGEQEQRTEDAGDEQEEEACVVRKLPDQTASFFFAKAQSWVWGKS